MHQYRTQILSTGSAFPQLRRSNSDLAKIINTSDEWIFERTGIKARRIANPEAGETNTKIATQAALQALEAAKLSAEKIDCILFATVTPDHTMPSSACQVQTNLGAKNAFAFDISAACSGFVYGIEIADLMIRSGKYENILVIGAEVLSPIVNWKDRGTCILFGDGAGAAILTRTTVQSKMDSQIFSTHLYSDGNLQDLLHIPSSGSALPPTPERISNGLQYVHMKGKEIFKVAVKCLADCSIKALEVNNFQTKDIDWVVPHQANLRIIEAVSKRLEIPMEKFILNIEEYANTSSATVPTALDLGIRSGKIKKGDLILFTVFGAGLTYGSSLIRL